MDLTPLRKTAVKTVQGARSVLRLSGTGTVGATLRIYLERFEDDPARMAQDPQQALAAVTDAAGEIAGIAGRLGRKEPDVRTWWQNKSIGII